MLGQPQFFWEYKARRLAGRVSPVARPLMPLSLAVELAAPAYEAGMRRWLPVGSLESIRASCAAQSAAALNLCRARGDVPPEVTHGSTK